MSAPKKPDARKGSRHKGRPVGLRVPEPVYQQVVRRAEQERRSVAQMFVLLVESALARDGKAGQ